MERREVAFEVRSSPTATTEARAQLDRLEGIGLDDLAGVKTIVSLLVTRAMREGAQGPFSVNVTANSQGAYGSVASSQGWKSMEDGPDGSPGVGLTVINGFASRWGADGDLLRFAVSSA